MNKATAFASALLLVTACSTPLAKPACAEQKGTNKMATSQATTPASSGDIMLSRILLNPLGPNPLVPRLDQTTVGPYPDHAQAHEFHIAREENGNLVYLEDWARESISVPLDKEVGGKPLSDYEFGNEADDPKDIMPLFFMQSVDGSWSEVPIEKTQGENRFIRLRMVKSVRDNALTPVAAQIDQYVSRRREYIYHPDGTLAQIITRDRGNKFEPVVQDIKP